MASRSGGGGNRGHAFDPVGCARWESRGNQRCPAEAGPCQLPTKLDGTDRRRMPSAYDLSTFRTECRDISGRRHERVDRVLAERR